jgi:propionyl-CoA carboxylase alpha chain
MISKLLVWGESRTEAIVRMKRALEEYDLQGVNTTIPFCHFVMTNNQFQSGDYDTHFIDKHFSPDHLIKYHSIDESLAAIAAVLFDFGFKSKYSKTNLESSDRHRPISSRWKDSGRKEGLRKQ